MNFNTNYFNDNDSDNDLDYKSAYPLFNFDALRKSQNQEVPLNLITSDKISEIIEEITTKKIKTDNNVQVIPKKRGRKAVAKNGKDYDDPTITIQEIIENDLVGIPMKSEIKMREERLKKIQDKKAQKKAEREKGTTTEIKAIENFTPVITTAPAFTLDPIIFDNQPVLAPQIIFKDGKVMVDNTLATRDQKLTIIDDAKPRKVTSMSFRTRNNTAKWTAEETKKFYKGIEIFGADFSLIAKLFPTRNRDQIKNKFNKEEKTNVNRMNDAFKRNTVLCKRSIMDRIRNFNNMLTTDDTATAAPAEFDIETGGFKALERQYSNTSTDSMDLKIMEEIQDIFLKEIRPRNAITAGFPNTANMIADRPFGFSNPQDNTILRDININTVKDAEPEQTRIFNNKENLLLRLIK